MGGVFQPLTSPETRAKVKQAPSLTSPMSIANLELYRNNSIYLSVLNHAIPTHGAHSIRAHCAVLYIADELR